MIIEYLGNDGTSCTIPTNLIRRLVLCPARVLDVLPLREIEEYVKRRKEIEK